MRKIRITRQILISNTYVGCSACSFHYSKKRNPDSSSCGIEDLFKIERALYPIIVSQRFLSDTYPL